jgi:hypothetical protein
MSRRPVPVQGRDFAGRRDWILNRTYGSTRCLIWIQSTASSGRSSTLQPQEFATLATLKGPLESRPLTEDPAEDQSAGRDVRRFRLFLARVRTGYPLTPPVPALDPVAPSVAPKARRMDPICPASGMCLVKRRCSASAHNDPASRTGSPSTKAGSPTPPSARCATRSAFVGAD